MLSLCIALCNLESIQKILTEVEVLILNSEQSHINSFSESKAKMNEAFRVYVYRDILTEF